ncbi:hypothetical protein G6F56_001135 [Rhizopus delemar]|uniref:Uncharacterized protein n=1 Tax=Rhizopus stolonifer TaxID=4846 RepID=A0A367KY76_RHIST|nr:hypothetical protein G6F56_001135 [Rhizopus delemar]RCI07169.1 hypothetical protein CU098_013915 [Rhizopus stolonifer]
MFRTAASQTPKLSLWRFPAQCYSTEVKTGLSERLGAGRGKVVAGADTDPFSSFLSRTNSSTGNDNRARNGNRSRNDNRPRNENRPRNDNSKGNGLMSSRNNNQRRNRTPVEGQFDDASEKVDVKGSSNKEKMPQKDRKPFDKQRDANRRNNNRRSGVRHEAVRANRATSFIDKDIDWESLDVIPVQQVSVVEDQQVEIKDDDYKSYLSAGAEINWSESVKGDAVRTLVGVNPSLDLQQKTAFLTAVANATSIQRVAVNK